MGRITQMAQELAQHYRNLRYALTDKLITSVAALKDSHRLVISTQFSEATIYPCPAFNWLFRAHHDSLHLKHDLDFTLASEIEVTKRGLRELSLDTSPLLADLYWSDNVGQQLYFYKHGAFPVNQIAFIESYLKGETCFK